VNRVNYYAMTDCGRMCNPPAADGLPASGASTDAKAEEGYLCLRVITLAGERPPPEGATICCRNFTTLGHATAHNFAVPYASHLAMGIAGKLLLSIAALVSDTTGSLATPQPPQLNPTFGSMAMGETCPVNF